MMIGISALLLAIGIVLGITSERARYGLIGLFMIIQFLPCLILTFSLEEKIEERGCSPISQEIVEYELASLQVDTAISGSGSRSYLKISENIVYHFYYKTSNVGKEGFAPKTITSKNVFLAETYEREPVVIEIRTTYDYQLTEFEKWWFGGAPTTLQPFTMVGYEIYVPPGSIVEGYELN